MTVPLIDVYATAGTFADTGQLAADLAAAVMTTEQVPDIPMFRQNTAAFIHDLPAGHLSNVDGDGNYVRIQVLTNAGCAGPRQAAGRSRAADRYRRRCRQLSTQITPPQQMHRLPKASRLRPGGQRCRPVALSAINGPPGPLHK